MSLSDTELDKKLQDLLKVMISRLPADKKLSASVVQQLLRAKYPTVYPEAYITSHESFIAETIATLTAEKESAAAAAAKTGVNGKDGAGSEGSDDDDDDEDDSSDDEESDEEGDGSEEDEEDEEDEDDFDSSEGDDDEEDQEDDEEEPEKKKQRQEEEARLLEKTAGGNVGEDVAERCKGMVACLKKLSYRVRAPNADESLEDYLNKYLVAEFEKHKMDPNRYGKNDIKHYKIQREVELLQQDGASLNLDRRNRVGRGYAGVDLNSAAAPTETNYKTSAFLDDEE